jgi:type VI secretion system secreted protein Hcp
MSSLRPSRLSKTLALVPPTVALVAQHASGAFDAFIKIGDIDGESTDAKHAKWIEIQSVQWDVKREIVPIAGSPTREPAAPKISELKLTKLLDRSSPAIFLNAVGGSSPIPSVILELVDASTSGVFYRITLTDVLVSSQQQTGVLSEDRPREEISLNFTKIKIEYFYQDAKGTVAVPAVGFDLQKQAPF